MAVTGLDPGTLAGVEVAAVAIAVALVAALGFLFTWAILTVSKREPGAMLATIVGLLTLVAILAFAVTQSETLGAIAASGVGALGAALANLFDTHRRLKQLEDDRDADGGD